MNKGGLGHIEMMLSFLIFIGFVIFALYFFNPSDPSRTISSSQSYIFDEIIKDVSVEVESYSVKINTPLPTPPAIPESIKVEIKGVDSKKRVRVESSSGLDVGSVRTGDSVQFNLESKLYNGGKGFAIIKFSEDYIPSSVPLDSLNSVPDYTISSSNKIQVISEKRMNSLEQRYNADYNGLTGTFNIPSSANFEFELIFDSDPINNIKAERERPENVEIFPDVKRVEVLRENGGIEFADLIVRVW